MTPDVVLAIDEGTSSARAIAYDRSWRPIAVAGRPLATAHPHAGWAEQDPAAILDGVVATVGEVLAAIGGPERVAAVGVANQGETVVAWDRETGNPLAPAVLWSCRRSQPVVDRVAVAGHGDRIRRLTGLPLDPYFSASKIRWLLDEVPGVADAARSGRLAVGTVDAWLTGRLGGDPRTDPSTASRTQLLALSTLAWDAELAAMWGIPTEILPRIVQTSGDLGSIAHPDWGTGLPLRAMVCDQQAALAGQAGHRPGAIKATFGTGVFVLANAGSSVPEPPPGILATIAWTDPQGRPTYAYDGGVFSAGALLDWLRELGILGGPEELDSLAGAAGEADVRILPALAGLGAPWWRPDARVVMSGLSAATGPADVARAAVDAIAQRAADVVEAMDPSGEARRTTIRVDGGLTASHVLVQRFADLVGRPVEVAADPESTALGTALLAGIGAGLVDAEAAASVAGTARCVTPALPEHRRRVARSDWKAFVTAAVGLTPTAATGSHRDVSSEEDG